MLDNAKEYPFFSNVHVTFAKIDHILDHEKKKSRHIQKGWKNTKYVILFPQRNSIKNQ